MAREFDHILLIGFGGPERPEEIRPFLEIVSRGRAIPEPRLAEVAGHYERIGGRSPYNQSVFRLAERLEESLCRQGTALPIFSAMRNWHPFLKDVIRTIRSKGFQKAAGVILAPHRSEASCGRYLKAVEEAGQDSGAGDYECAYLKTWHDHPLFIQGQAEQVRRILDQIPAGKKTRYHLLFSAHSIPVEMEKQSRYAEEFRRSCELVAKELNYSDWSLAYQSRSGNPNQPWLEPDICAVIRGLKAKGNDGIVVVPIGFVCDNAEVLYDLDIEAREEAAKIGLEYFRAPVIMDHPQFAAMLTELIQDELARPAGSFENRENGF